MNNLSRLLTAKNLAMLDALSKKDHTLRDLAVETGCSPAKAHQAIRLFEAEGIIHTARHKNQLRASPNRSHPLYRTIVALINLHQLTHSSGLIALSKIGKVGVYGSYANGTDDLASDIDLVIITKKTELELRPILRRLAEELKHPVAPLLLSLEQFARLEKNDPAFASRLRQTTVGLTGELFD